MIDLLRVGALICVLLLAACGSSVTPDSGGGQLATGTVAAQTETGHSSAASAQPGETSMSGAGTADSSQVAVLTRSGGIQGQTETLVVLPDGTLQVINGEPGEPVFKEGKATPDQVAKLQGALQDEGWQKLDATYGQPLPDAYTYTILANGKTITTYDGAQRPALLEDVMGQIDALWQQALKG